MVEAAAREDVGGAAGFEGAAPLVPVSPDVGAPFSISVVCIRPTSYFVVCRRQAATKLKRIERSIHFTK